jgi:predicted nucleotide-binding protein
MKKGKNYVRTKFSPEVLRASVAALTQESPPTPPTPPRRYLVVNLGHETWHHESEEEFFADYRRPIVDAVYQLEGPDWGFRLQVVGSLSLLEVSASKRSSIARAFEVLDAAQSDSLLPEAPSPPPPTPVVFLGHGGSPLWRDLRDHLQDKHGITVEAYEIGSRAGHAIRDVLESMMRRSSIAFLVLTAEDVMADGSMHARQNVVHELGLFQGALGFSRAIAVLEEGTEEFSNLHGIEQIRFASGRIRETFGEVLATIKREVGIGA